MLVSAQTIPRNIEAEQISSKLSNFIREFNISQLLRLSNFNKIKVFLVSKCWNLYSRWCSPQKTYSDTWKPKKTVLIRKM